MPKAALVMDMPETCENCACKYPSYKDDALYDCAITGKEIPINGGHYEEKPDSCPLRELPEKMDCFAEAIKNDCYDGTEYEHEYLDGKSDGWNACLDEILKVGDADGTH